MKNYILMICLIFPFLLSGQGEVIYAVKLAGGLSSQNFTTQRGGLTLTPGIDLYVANKDEDVPAQLYAQLGYHQRGSSRRQGGFSVKAPAYRFDNVVLELGALREYEANEFLNYYYMLGVRGEVTVHDNLDQVVSTNSFGSLNFLAPTFTKRFLYGLSVGGGLKGTVAGKTMCLEVSVQPDLSSQYDQPYQLDYTHPVWGRVILPPRKGRNISVEVKLGYFL